MMNALTFLIVLMSLIPIASGYFQSVTTAEPLTVTKKVISLENFLAYRGAVLTYAEKIRHMSVSCLTHHYLAYRRAIKKWAVGEQNNGKKNRSLWE